MPTNDTGTPEFWRTVKPGDMLVLSDEKTIEEQMGAGLGVKPAEISICSVARVEIRNKADQRLADYVILDLGEGKSAFVKLVDRAVGVSLYAEGKDWEPTTREALLKDDCTFLWEAPEGDWKAGDLRYISEIMHDASGVRYFLKPQGELTGKVSYAPKKDGSAKFLATIAEYSAGIDCDSPELVVTEIGDDGAGLIKLHLGRSVSVHDVDVFVKG